MKVSTLIIHHCRKAIEIDAIGSRTEPGCLRFDVLQDKSDPNKFVFYEVYKDADAINVHKSMPHFKAWTDFKVLDDIAIMALCYNTFTGHRRRCFTDGHEIEWCFLHVLKSVGHRKWVQHTDTSNSINA